MKIIVSTHDPVHPLHGAGSIRTVRCAVEFKKRGHEVLIIAPTDGADLVEGIRTEWLHAPRKHRSQLLSSLKFNIRLTRKYLKFIRQTDLLFVHNTIAAVSVPFLRPFFSFRFVLDVTDIHAEYFAAHETKGVLKRLLAPLLLWMEYRIIRSADRVIVVTHAMKEQLLRRGISAERIEVVMDGCVKAEFSSEKKRDAEHRVIHLGLIDRQHGVECFIRAIPSVLQKCPNASFLIVGGGRELDRLKQLTKQLSISTHCVFTGHLPHEQARAYLAEAAIGVIPRPDTLANRLVTTLKIYEYWASGTAVVSSRLAGIEEVATEGRTALFFEPGQPEDLAKKLLILLENRNLREHLRQESLKSLGNYEWGLLASRIVDFALRPVLPPSQGA